MKIITDMRIVQGKGYFKIEVKTIEVENKVIQPLSSGAQIVSPELVITGEESKWTRVPVINEIPVNPN